MAPNLWRETFSLCNYLANRNPNLSHLFIHLLWDLRTRSRGHPFRCLIVFYSHMSSGVKICNVRQLSRRRRREGQRWKSWVHSWSYSHSHSVTVTVTMSQLVVSVSQPQCHCWSQKAAIKLKKRHFNFKYI